jgi:hypothetical protein
MHWHIIALHAHYTAEAFRLKQWADQRDLGYVKQAQAKADALKELAKALIASEAP